MTVIRQTGQPSYARAIREGIWITTVCDGYQDIQIATVCDSYQDIRIATVCNRYQDIHVSMENFVDIQQVIGGLVDEIPADRFTSRLRGYQYTCIMPG